MSDESGLKDQLEEVIFATLLSYSVDAPRVRLARLIQERILPVLESHVQDQLAELSNALEYDRTKVAEGVTAIKKVLSSRGWLTEGRGSYSYDDDKWHNEFAAAISEIELALEPLVHIAANWKGCPKDWKSVQAARKDQLDDALAQVAELQEVLTKLCDKLDVVAKDSAGVFQLANIHGMSYTGANYSQEYEAARTILKEGEADKRVKD